MLAASQTTDPARRLAWTLGRGGGALERLATARALAAMGERAASAVGDIAALLGHRDAGIVATGAFVLAELGGLAFEEEPDLAAALVPLTVHESSDVRLWAVQALARDPKPGGASVAALGRLMGDADQAVRHAAIEGAGRIGPAARGVIAPLLAAALDGLDDNGRAARRALPSVEGVWERLSAAAIERAEGSLPLALLAARYARPGNGAEAAALAFLATAKEADWRRVVDELDGDGLTPAVAEAIGARLGVGDVMSRMAAANALGRARGVRIAATEALLRHTGDSASGWAVGCALIALWHGETMPAAAEAGLAAVLAAPAAPGDTLILLTALQELAVTPAGCAEALCGLVRHRHDGLRCAAALALGGLASAGESAFDALRRALGDQRFAVRVAACRSLAALGADRTELVARLAPIAQEGSPGERVKAMRAIAAMGIEGEAASDILETALRDPNPAVRESAGAALAQLEAANF